MRTLLLSQRVNRAFRYGIRRSPQLRKELFFEPPTGPADGEQILHWERRQEGTSQPPKSHEKPEVHLNDLLLQTLRGEYNDLPIMQSFDRPGNPGDGECYGPGWQSFQYQFGKEVVKYGSWREMYIALAPLELEMFEFDGSYGSGKKYSSRTMGQFVDDHVKWWEAENECSIDEVDLICGVPFPRYESEGEDGDDGEEGEGQESEDSKEGGDGFDDESD